MQRWGWGAAVVDQCHIDASSVSVVLSVMNVMCCCCLQHIKHTLFGRLLLGCHFQCCLAAHEARSMISIHHVFVLCRLPVSFMPTTAAAQRTQPCGEPLRLACMSISWRLCLQQRRSAEACHSLATPPLSALGQMQPSCTMGVIAR